MSKKISKVLFVNPHETRQCGFTTPPLGLLYLAGTLIPHGFDARIVDGCKDGKDAVSDAIRTFAPELIGITCLTPGRNKVIELVNIAKAINPDVTVVLGGVHPTIMYTQMMEQCPGIDFIVIGEGEASLLEIAQAHDPATISGIVYRTPEGLKRTKNREQVKNLDEIPFPAWHLIDLHAYQARGEFVYRGIDLRVEPRVSVIFSRGCKGHCDFCSSWWVWQGWRHRSPKNMVDELELLYRSQGIRHFCFADDALTVNREATLELCDEIITRGLQIAFHATTRSDCVDEEVLQKLSAAGCYNIAYGIETGSPELLKKMLKENDIDTAERAIRLTKKAGIIATALIIVGNVGETEETLAETVRFLNRTQPDIIGCAGGLWIFPGTKLYRDCQRQGLIDDSFWLGDEPYKIYTNEWPIDVLEQMEQIIYNHNQYKDMPLPQLKKQCGSAQEKTFLEKWQRYVQADLNEYSATTQWPDAQEQHHELMSKIPLGCRYVLDLGCGDGWSSNELSKRGFEVSGVTINPKEAVHAEKTYGLKLSVCDMHDLTFADRTFDCIYSRESYEHSVAPYISLCEMNRVLKRDGYLLVNLPWDDWIREDSHYSVFTPSQMREMLYKCKFVVEEEGQTTHGHFWYLARKVAEIGEAHPFPPPVPGLPWLKGVVLQPQEVTRPSARAPERLSERPRIVCQMRIKNEEKWLSEVLDRIAHVADAIVILDDGSTDRTPEICKQHPAVKEYYWQNEPTIDEVRDKNRLLKMALAQDPDWVLCMDGDEILEESAPERLLQAMIDCPPDVCTIDIEFLYMWNDLQHYRTDGIYKSIYHHRLFKLAGQERDTLAFAVTAHGGNFHCESVPSNLRGRAMRIDVKVLHLGYMYASDRERKYHWYKKNDPIHAAQGYYEHLLDQPGMTIAEWRERPYEVNPSPASPPGNGPKSTQELKPSYYYANARRNIADLVPKSARRVLDVGCGQGLTGGLIRAERGIEVVGLELHPEVAEVAKSHLSKVVIGDLESMELPFAPGYFDCIILADVLEHFANPWLALKKISTCLSHDGTIIASIPNVRNLGVIGKLIGGSWEYAEQGILDRTHLRFFALKDMLELFASADMVPRIAEVVRDPLFENVALEGFGSPSNIEYGRLALKNLSAEELEELTTQQYIFVASRKTSSSPTRAGAKQPAVSVVIPVYNNFSYTEQCLKSIFSIKEKNSFEIIVVDDASADDSANRIAGLGFQLRVLRNDVNKGFAASCNIGARAATGKYLLFLNNDTVVLPGWLDALVECLESSSSIGLVGGLQIFPDSGKVQQAGIVCGENKMLYSIYNNQLSADHPAVNKSREFQFVAGSCMMLERGLFAEIGGFDEAYLNSCEDVDLCMKVRRSGRKVFYCHQSRIYHFESKTVLGHPKNSANYQLFLERWGSHLQRDDFTHLEEDGFLSPSHLPTGTLPRVTLIAPPRYFKHPMVSGYSGYSKNLGLGYIASLLQESVPVSIVDAFASGIELFLPVDLPNGRVYRCGLPFEEIAARIPADSTLIGISIPFTNVASIAFDLAAFLKPRFPEACIVLGGVHPSTFPTESLAQAGVDCVIAGEGEYATLALAKGEPPETIPGLYWKDERGAVRSSTPQAVIKELDELPFPAWDLLPMENYFTVSPRGDRVHRALSMITSRGCPFSCLFCSVHPVSGKGWRARSPENVLAEISLACRKYGINHLEIEDDNFTLDKKRALSILRGLKEIDPLLTWSAHNGVRVDTLDEELLLAIKESGCIQLNLAIEHGSPAVLQAMNKQLSLDKVREAVALCGKLGIPSNGFCIVGHPGENAETFRESFLFFQQLLRSGLTRVIPFIINAYPGTPLYHQAREKGWLAPNTDSQLFFLEDEFVSVLADGADQFTIRRRKMAMDTLNSCHDIDASATMAMI